MTARPRPVLRSTLGRLAVTGAAGLATVMAVAPVAVADDLAPVEAGTGDEGTGEPPAPVGEPTPEAPVEEQPDAGAPGDSGEEPADGTEDPAAEEPDAEVEDPSAEEPVDEAEEDVSIAADFGVQKYRVGVQIPDGRVVPEGTTTLGSVIRIKGDDGTDFTCTTTIPDTEPGSTASFCAGGGIQERAMLDVPKAIAQRLRAAVVVEPDEGGPGGAFATDGSGETLTLTQESAPAGLVPDPESATLEPCLADEDFPIDEFCTDEDGGFKQSLVLFDAAPLPPNAVDDSATTDEDESVVIDVLDNDDPRDIPVTDVDVDSQPDDGTAKVSGSGGQAVIRYTPDAGFRGTDTFTYELETANGTDVATVRVRVRGDGSVGSGDETTDEPAGAVSPASASSALPDTGGPDVRLLGLGGVLVAAGGWLAARRRPTADALAD